MGVHFTVAGALGLVHGSTHIEDRAFGGPQPRLVTAMLLVGRDQAWTAEQLADQLWPAGPPQRWRPAVRALVSRVRALLADAGVDGMVVSSRAGHYHVELSDLSVDLELAHGDVVRAGRAVAEGRFSVADDLAGRARTVLSRPILTGVDAPWVEDLRQVVAPDHIESLLLLGRARLGQGRWSAARSVLHEALARAPFREEAWRDLMTVENAAGNMARALQIYEECRRQLADELGVDPSPQTQALHAAVLRGLPTPAREPGGSIHLSPADISLTERGVGETGHSADLRPPYVGLRAFEREDADRFFGRDATVQRLVDLLAAHGAVTVVGPSGSGKSSLVRAGLLPALASGAIPDADTWPVAVVVPGRQPLRALAASFEELARHRDGAAPPPADLVRRLLDDPGELHRAATRVLAAVGADPAARVALVLDQAEELFTVADAAQAAALLAGVAAAVRRRAPRVAVVATMRADFYVRAASNHDMAALLSRSQLVIPPLSGSECEAAIVGPAGLVGATLERGIVGQMVAEATGQPGRLPLLQHTLWELWQSRDGSTLTIEGYERIGGLTGALARHAERTWESVGDQALARRVLLRGVAPGDRSEVDTRRSIHRDDLLGVAEPDKLTQVVEHLVSHRLLQAQTRVDDTVFELAHEALITSWPRLHGWVAEQRSHLVTARALGAATERWTAADRDPDWLLQGRLLNDTVELRRVVDDGELDLVLSQAELELVSASEKAAAVAQAHQRVERGLAAGALTLSEDPEAALLLGLELLDDVRERVPERRAELASLLHRGIHRHRLIRRGSGLGALLAVSADGELIAVAEPTSRAAPPGATISVRLHRVRDGKCVASLPGHPGRATPRGAFSADRSRLVTGDGDGIVRTWRLADGELESCWAATDGPVGGLDVAAGSGLVAVWGAVGHDRQLVVCTPDGERLHVIPPDGTSAFEEDLPRPGRLVAFHPDGSHLLVAIGDVARRIDLVDVDSWQVLASTTRRAPAGSTLNLYREVTSLEWNQHGTQVAVAFGAATQILDGDSLDVVRSALSDTRSSVTWTRDGGAVVTAGRSVTFLDRREPDPEVDTPTPAVVIHPTSPSADRLRVRAVPGSDHVLLGGELSGAVDLHDASVSGPAEIANLEPMKAQGVAWSPDGARMAVGRGDGVIAVLETETWEEVERYRAHGHAEEQEWPSMDGPVAWAPDGSFVASIASDGTLAIRHLADGSTLTVRVGEASNWPGDCDITPDSRHVAAVVMGTAMVVRRDGSVVATLDVPSDHLGSSRLSADGSLLAIPRRGGRGRAVRDTWTTHLWEWASQAPPRRLGPEGTSFGESLSFHPDGTTVAFGSDDPVVRIVDTRDGRVLHELNGHSVQVLEVAHHPAGHLLASSGWDGTVRVWNLATHEEVAMRDGLTGQPGSLAFHPTRPWLAVADWSGVVRVWTLDLDELADVARTRVTRDLTEVERRRLQH